MRIIFIHGLGEKDDVFSKIAPDISGEHSYINFWEALGNKKRPNLDVISFCIELIDKYGIHRDDVIIGHSTGARLAYYIKHLNGNTIVQIAGWTKQGKTLFPIKSRHVIYFLVRSGVLMSKVGINHMIKNYRRRENTKSYYVDALNNIKEGNRNCVVNQFKLALEDVKESVIAEPDLRIHAKRDNIVRYPDEAFVEVPGDHFSLLTHPKEVSGIINDFLKRRSATSWKLDLTR